MSQVAHSLAQLEIAYAAFQVHALARVSKKDRAFIESNMAETRDLFTDAGAVHDFGAARCFFDFISARTKAAGRVEWVAYAAPRKPSIRIVSEADGTILRAMYGDRCLASALMRRPYAKGALFTLSRSNGADAGTAGSLMEARRMLRQVAAAYLAEMDAPAAPVASDPVPADVPCYLAVSTDGAGVETVMGVFRVAEHASADAAEIEAGKLCERIERAAPGAVCHVRANPDVNAAFADLATAEHTLRNLSADSTVWASAFDRREAARERAVSLDPVRFVRTYPSQAYAFRHLLPADMVARIEAAEDDAELRAAVGAPAMVPQPAQQQQGRAPELTPHPIYNRTQFPHFVCHHGNWDIYANATGWCASIPTASAAADGCRASHFGDAAYVLATLGVRVMVPQPCQPQQGRARGRAIQPPRGERRYVTVRDTETGEMHRVLTSVARVGFAVVVFVPSNRHRQGALSGMLITHDDTRKAWVFNDEAEARHMLSCNRAPGERVIPAELVSDPAV